MATSIWPSPTRLTAQEETERYASLKREYVALEAPSFGARQALQAARGAEECATAAVTSTITQNRNLRARLQRIEEQVGRGHLHVHYAALGRTHGV